MIGKSIAAIMLGTGLDFGQPSAVRAASKSEIDAKVREAIGNFYTQTSTGKQLPPDDRLESPALAFSSRPLVAARA